MVVRGIVIGFIGLGLGTILAGTAVTGMAFSPAVLVIAAVVFLIVLFNFVMTPLINKINAELQKNGTNSALGKYASTGNVKYRKDAFKSYLNKLLSSIIQMSSITSVGVLVLAIAFGTPTLVTTALISAVVAVIATIAFVVINRKIAPNLKAIKKIKSTANAQQSKMSAISTGFMIGIIGLVSFVFLPAVV
jgi:hypothetical protein